MKILFLSPLYQGAAIVVLMGAGLIVCRIMKSPIIGWNLSAVVILLFCLLNAIAGFFAAGVWFYLLKSVGVLLLLVVAAIVLSSLITGMSLDEFGADAMVFMAPFVYYPFMLVIMGLFRLFMGGRP